MKRKRAKRSKMTPFAVAVALVAALTACGDGEDKDGSDSSSETEDFAERPTGDIIEAAQTAMGDVESLRITGDLVSGGTAITMDLSLSAAGDCDGRVGIDGGGVEVLQVDGERWFKADDAFWRAQAPGEADQIIAATSGNWVVDSGGQFTSFCDLDGYIEGIVSPDASNEEFVTDGVEDVDGRPALKFVEGELSAWVATEEPHHLLKLEFRGAEPGMIAFTDFDEDVEVAAPAQSDIVTLP